MDNEPHYRKRKSPAMEAVIRKLVPGATAGEHTLLNALCVRGREVMEGQPDDGFVLEELVADDVYAIVSGIGFYPPEDGEGDAVADHKICELLGGLAYVRAVQEWGLVCGTERARGKQTLPAAPKLPISI